MAFVIEWTAHCSGSESIFDVKTPAGGLTVLICNDVITRCQWSLRATNLNSHPFQSTLLGYWQNPHAEIKIKLLKQGSLFQQTVQARLCQTVLGETLTYGELAKTLGSSARAVGNACKNNPYPLLIPCHRVVSANGRGGYCGQTEGDFMMIKNRLLAFENQQTT